MPHKTIWKYELYVTGIQTVHMPIGSEILCVQTQNDNPCIWAKVDPDLPTKPVIINIFGTGHKLPEFPGKYIGTFQCKDTLVLHVFAEFKI